MRLSRRWTRKKPTAGARSSTTMPAPNASRMNSRSSMCVRGVMPEIWEFGGRSVEDDLAAHEHDPLNESLDRAELVGDVQDGDVEVAVELLEQRGERLLRLDIDPSRRLVEDEELRIGRQRLRDERALLLSARQGRQPPPRETREINAFDCLTHCLAITTS